MSEREKQLEAVLWEIHNMLEVRLMLQPNDDLAKYISDRITTILSKPKSEAA